MLNDGSDVFVACAEPWRVWTVGATPTSIVATACRRAGLPHLVDHSIWAIPCCGGSVGS